MNPNKTSALPVAPVRRTEWGFTAEPDFPRICRELDDAGCALGVVRQDGSPVTVYNTKKCRVVGSIRPIGRRTEAAGWDAVPGDLSSRIVLERARPVSVVGYGAPPSAPAATKAPESGSEAKADLLRRREFWRAYVACFAAAEWTQGDGAKIRVQEMTDSHLHFALAKAYRGEFISSVDRDWGIEALKAEATRRLLLSKLPEPAQGPAAASPSAPSPAAPKQWGVFCTRNGRNWCRSINRGVDGTFASQAAAQTALNLAREAEPTNFSGLTYQVHPIA